MVRSADAEIYGAFAAFYGEGGWSRYSAQVVRMLPAALERFGVWPRRLLDLACGEGTFAVAMAERGMRVTGVDRSPQMLSLARKRARAEGVTVTFLKQDMRSLNLRGPFDLVTCWFDSLNYLLNAAELQDTFTAVSRLLETNGLFFFDMNTIHGLAVEWVREPSYVHVNRANAFLVSTPRYDAVSRIATLEVTGFRRSRGHWLRMDEVHQERGYTLDEIRHCLKKAGLRELACWASLDRMDRPRPAAARVWFVAGKNPRR